MKKILHKIFERIKSLRNGLSETIYDISCDSTGFQVHWYPKGAEARKKSKSCLWQEVIAVYTFKRDLFAYDCIYIAFETPDGCFEVDEQMHGWDNLLKTMETSIQGFPIQDEWLQEVMLPPRKTNFRKIWAK